jgi:hypothetical protein
MKVAQTYKDYKSPPRKLLRFFERSRNQWKAKCAEAKQLVKRLKNRVRFLENSKALWKGRAQEVEAELVRTRAREQSLEKELATLKEKGVGVSVVSGYAEDVKPAHHTYKVGQVTLFVTLVLSAAASFRCASQTLKIVGAFLPLPLSTPSSSAGRLWLLRLGYYKLTRPKQQADDWVWIVDHTVQLGAEKCLVILGLRLCDWPPDHCLSYEDVEPIALYPVKHSNGTVVYQQLEETIEKTGVPREIVGDQGSDLRSGIEQFCQVHQQTSYIYDIKHKTAAILKHELHNDQDWLVFTKLAAQTKQQVQQTALAALAPPNQRSKARYMNVDRLIRWGSKVLTFLDQPAQHNSRKFDPQQIKEKLGWVIEFRESLEQWQQLLEVITTTESFVRKQGLYHGSCRDLVKELSKFKEQSERTKRVRQQLLTFVTTEELKVNPDERLLGSSEVLESLFGKLKRLEQDQAKNGFTALLLSMAAMVNTTTTEVVQKALETVPTKKILAWSKKNLGQSIQSVRKEVFAAHNKTEQKPDQLWTVV